MKKTALIIISVSLIFGFSSCKKTVDELLIGEWKNTNTEITKIDEIADLLYNLQVENLKEQIQLYADQLEILDDTMKFAYQEIIDNYQLQLDELTKEQVKKTILENLNTETITFNEDSTMSFKTTVDSVTGNWSVSEDGKSLNIQLETEIIAFDINEISKNSLIIKRNSDINEINFDVIYTFEK